MKKTILFVLFLSAFTLCRSQFNSKSTFNPVKFNPVYATPSTPDVSILRNSLNEREKRKEKAINSYSELAELASSYIDMLYQDEETLIWYQNLINPMLNQVKEDIDEGNYSNAIINASTFKTSLKTNSELRSRVSVCNEYNTVRDMVISRNDLTSEQKQKWLDTYLYKFVPIIHNNIIIGAKRWMEIGGPNETPVILP